MITTNNNGGIWIAIDGCECSGKTTLIEQIKKKHNDVVVVPEFSDSHLGIWLKNEVVSEPFYVMRSTISSALLFLSDYFELQSQIVAPALSNNKIVISDRGILSKIAVQFAILEKDHGNTAEEFLQNLFKLSLMPDLSVVLDTSEETVYERILKRSGSCDQERMNMNKRTNELIRYFGEKLDIAYECLPFDEAEKRIDKIIKEKLGEGL